VRRRDFLAVLAGATAMMSSLARPQPGEQSRDVAVLMGLAASDPFTVGYINELRGKLQELGWAEGRNIHIIYRYAAGSPEQARAFAEELNDLFRHAADYVDRILKGASPADLPVQAPTKYELVVNLKTANALGINVPRSLLARADEVIE
jgi:ABC-type uncharacterized transport system substrate-binding protein